ncbi:uncharacterized protein LOC144115812 [Amblyomma americanum]
MTERFTRGSGRPLVTKQKSMDDVLSELQGNAMFLSFGKRSGGTGRRMNECLILEPSEMVVVSALLAFPVRSWAAAGVECASTSEPRLGVVAHFAPVTAPMCCYCHSVRVSRR